MSSYRGSICLSNIPKELIKEVTCKDGTVRKYLNVALIERKQVGMYGDTHFLSCSPPKDQQVEGKNYIIGDFKPLVSSAAPQPTLPQPTQQNNQVDDLPF